MLTPSLQIPRRVIFLNADGYDDITDSCGLSPDMGAYPWCCAGIVLDDCGVCGGTGEQQTCGCGEPNTLGFPDGECDCHGNILDECGVCGGEGIADGSCDCFGQIADCEGVCGGISELDICDECNGDGMSCTQLPHFKADEDNIGWAKISYTINDLGTMDSNLYRAEIQADTNVETYLQSKTLNPTLYVYRINEGGEIVDSVSISADNISADSLNTIIDLPGAIYVQTSSLVIIPDYLVEGFPIYPINEEAPDSTAWLGILGMYVKIDNFYSSITEPNALVKMEETFFSDTTLSNRIDIKMKYTEIIHFLKQPYFDYQIEFGTTLLDTAVYGIGRDCSHIDGHPDGTHTFLPFKITNLTLNNQADLSHYDNGIYYGQADFGDVGVGGCSLCKQDEWCIGARCLESSGYKNCNWEREEVLLLEEIIHPEVDSDTDLIYDFKIGFDIGEYYNHVGADPIITEMWSVPETYSFGEIVYHEGMLYKAMENISITNLPDEWFDENGDNVNDNPWKILYPWEEGDFAIISMHKQLHDGDNWILDMSVLWGCTNPDACNYNPYAIVDDVNCIFAAEYYNCEGNCLISQDIDENGECDGILSIDQELIPTIFSISSIYPNPFNPTTTISFSIPEFGLTTITAYDITGKKLEILTNTNLNPGNYSIDWNASSYPSGVYLIRMDSGDFTQTQKVVLVK